MFYSWWIVKRKTPAQTLVLDQTFNTSTSVWVWVSVCVVYQSIEVRRRNEYKCRSSLKELTQDELFDGWRLTKADTIFMKCRSDDSCLFSLCLSTHSKRIQVLRIQYDLCSLSVLLSESMSSQRKSRGKSTKTPCDASCLTIIYFLHHAFAVRFVLLQFTQYTRKYKCVKGVKDDANTFKMCHNYSWAKELWRVRERKKRKREKTHASVRDTWMVEINRLLDEYHNVTKCAFYFNLGFCA